MELRKTIIDILLATRSMPEGVAADAILSAIGSGAEPIYQVWYFDGGWRDVSKEIYERESHRDDVRIVYTSPAPTAQDSLPNEHGSNRYGLDMAYFRNLINRELNHSRGLYDYKPSELARVFVRMAAAADRAVLQEPEFHPAQDSKVPEGYVLARKDDVEASIRMMRYACHPHKSPHADDLESGMLFAAPSIAEKREWISCGERLPTEHDYDLDGKVWIRGVADNGEEYVERVTENEGPKFVEGDTHWAPTGLQRPQPPEVEQ